MPVSPHLKPHILDLWRIWTGVPSSGRGAQSDPRDLSVQSVGHIEGLVDAGLHHRRLCAELTLGFHSEDYPSVSLYIKVIGWVGLKG